MANPAGTHWKILNGSGTMQWSPDNGINYDTRIIKDGVGTLRIDNSTTTAGGKLKVDSVVLATTGGTATALDYYETGTYTGDSWTGPWATSQATTISFTRIGNIVNLSIPAVSAAGANDASIALTIGLPVRLRPATGKSILVNITSNSVRAVGNLYIQDSGQIQIYATVGDGNFATTNNAGFQPLALTYSLA